MTAPDFIAKWSKVDPMERSAAQQHSPDLCELVSRPKPAAADPAGESFTFEKATAKHGCRWLADLIDEQILERLLVLNLDRAAEEATAMKTGGGCNQR